MNGKRGNTKKKSALVFRIVHVCEWKSSKGNWQINQQEKQPPNKHLTNIESLVGIFPDPDTSKHTLFLSLSLCRVRSIWYTSLFRLKRTSDANEQTLRAESQIHQKHTGIHAHRHRAEWKREKWNGSYNIGLLLFACAPFCALHLHRTLNFSRKKMIHMAVFFFAVRFVSFNFRMCVCLSNACFEVDICFSFYWLNFCPSFRVRTEKIVVSFLANVW